MSPQSPPVVAVGASSGGLDPLRDLVRGLAPDFPGSVLIARHVGAGGPSILAELLAAETDLPVADAVDGEPLEPGRVFVAPVDRHLLVDRDRVRLSRGPRENRFRPAIDPLFRSAAVHRGTRAIGVVLSGQLDDGTAGLIAIRRAGGLAVAQSPDEAAAPSMPASAIAHAGVDHEVAAKELGPLLTRLMTDPGFGRPGPPAPDDIARELKIVSSESGAIDDALALGRSAYASCPDCGGPMWEMGEGEFKHYRCHTGHSFTARHLVDGLRESEERALWVALRVMDERERMLRRLADESGGGLAETYRQKADEAAEHTATLRRLLGGDGNDAERLRTA